MQCLLLFMKVSSYFEGTGWVGFLDSGVCITEQKVAQVKWISQKAGSRTDIPIATVDWGS